MDEVEELLRGGPGIVVEGLREDHAGLHIQVAGAFAILGYGSLLQHTFKAGGGDNFFGLRALECSGVEDQVRSREIDRQPRLSHWFERFEYYGKKEVFGCQNCGNCVLGSMEYVCPQTCPKQMRNGPCGGTFHGACEVIDQQCIWVKVMERAEASNTIDQLKVFIPAPDRTLTDREVNELHARVVDDLRTRFQADVRGQ